MPTSYISRLVLMLGFLSLPFFALRAQNTCASPHVITAIPFPATGSVPQNLTTCGKGREYSNFMTCFNRYMFNQDYVFEFTPDATNNCIDITAVTQYRTPGLFLVDGCPDSDTSECVGQDFGTDNTIPQTLSLNNMILTPGETYYIIVAGLFGCGDFRLNIQETTNCTPDEPGSRCENAVEIDAVPYTTTTQTTCGKRSYYNNGNPCGDNILDSEEMVFSYTPDVDACIDISFANHLNSMGVKFYHGCPDEVGTKCLQQDNDIDGVLEITSTLVDSGETYYIVVARRSNASPPCGIFDMTINALPLPNGDDCSAPFVISSIPHTETGTSTFCRRDDYFHQDLCNTFFMSGKDIVYELQVAENGCYEFAVENMSRLGGLSLLSGCPTDTNTFCIRSEQGNGEIRFIQNLPGPATYTIVISSRSATIDVTYDFSITSAGSAIPSNCAVPFDVPSLPYTSALINTQCQGDDYTSSIGCQHKYVDGEDIVFEYQASGPICLEARMLNSTGLSGLYAFDGCPSFGSSRCLGGVVCESDLGCDTTSLFVSLPAAGSYYFVLSAADIYGNESFQFDLREAPTESKSCYNCSTLECDPCNNIGFELGNPSTWSGFTGLFSNPMRDAGLDTGIVMVYNDRRNRHGIVTRNSVDPILKQSGIDMPVVDHENGGNYALRLGNSDIHARAESISTTIDVDTANSLLIYSYAVVLEDPGHARSEQPFFKIRVFDESNNSIACAEYEVTAGAGVAGFQDYNHAHGGRAGIYKTWTDVAVPLTDYIGQTVRLEFVSADCSQGGHFGYCYIDGRCEEFNVFAPNDTFICEGDTITMEAPSGMELYQWSNGETTQNIQVHQPGDYAVTMTTFTGCVEVLEMSLSVDPLPSLDFEIDNNCVDSSVRFTNLSQALGASPFKLSNWNLGDGTLLSDSLHPEHRYGAVNSYRVFMESFTQAGCFDTFSKVIDLRAPVDASTSMLAPLCEGNDTIQLLANNGGGYWFGQGLINNRSGEVDISALAPGNYGFLHTFQDSCSAEDSTWLRIKPQLAADITPADTLCDDGTAIQLMATDGGGIWRGVGVSDSIQGIVDPAIAQKGIHSITYTIDSLCGDADTTLLVVQLVVLDSIQAFDIRCAGELNGQARVFSADADSFSLDGSNWQSSSQFGSLAVGTYTAYAKNHVGCVDQMNFEIEGPDALSLTLNSYDAYCQLSNGRMASAVTGGRAPYTFSWSNGASTDSISGLAPGTYELTVTDDSACVINQSDNISTGGFFQLSFTHDSVSCNGLSDGALKVATDGGFTPFTYTWSNSTSADSIQDAAGTYAVTVTDRDGCTAEGNAEIFEPSALQHSVATQEVLCAGDGDGRIDLEANGATPPYRFVYPQFPSRTGDSLINLNGGVYVYEVYDANNCLLRDSARIDEPDSLKASISVVHNTCNAAQNGSAQVAVIGGNVAYRYNWSDGVASGAQTSNLAAGEIRVTVTDDHNCRVIRIDTIDEPTALQLQFESYPSVCENEAKGSVKVTASGGTPPYLNYRWSNGEEGSDSIAQLMVGTYAVTVFDSEVCDVVGDTLVVQLDSTQVQAMIVDASCAGSADGRIVFTSDRPIVDYQWSDVVVQDADTAKQLGAGLYSVTMEDINGCLQSAQYQVTEPNSFSLAMGRQHVKIAGSSEGKAWVQVIGRDADTMYYEWSNGAMGIGIDTIEQLPAGWYSVTVYEQGRMHCALVDSVEVLEPPFLSLSESHQDASCAAVADGSIQVNVLGGQAPYDYSWSHDVNAVGATQQGLSLGSYRIVVTDSFGAVDSIDVQIDTISQMMLSTVNSPVRCFGESNASAAVITTGGRGGYQYAWSHDQAIVDSSLATLAAGSYTISVSDQAGCIDSIVVNISEPDTLVAQLDVDSISCYQEKVQARVNAQGGNGGYQYAWSNSTSNASSITGVAAGSHSITVTDGKGCTWSSSYALSQPSELVLQLFAVDVDCPGAQTGGLWWQSNGGSGAHVYRLNGQSIADTFLLDAPAASYQVQVEDDSGCVTSANILIQEPAAIQVQALIEHVCAGQFNGVIDLSESISGGTPPYSTIWGNGLQVSRLEQLFPGRYTYRVQDANSCVFDGAVEVLEYPSIQIGFVGDTLLDQGRTGELAIQVLPIADYQYFWLNSDQIIQDEGSRIEFVAEVDEVFVVEVFDNDNGCRAMDSIALEVIPRLHYLMPEAFTPNGDGANDALNVFMADGFELLNVSIFNRWGEMVYSGLMPWDGYYKGELQAMDAYSFKINYVDTRTGARYVDDGTVQLIK